MELHFIINPIAKNGYSLHIWSKIKKYLQEHQIPFRYRITEGPGDAQTYTEKVLQKTTNPVFLIAVGGDGTVHEVVNGSYSFKNGIVGCIPAGSGNDFSRGLSLPKSPKKALQYLLHLIKKQRSIGRIDIGKYGTNLKNGVFVNNLGCGFDAQVVYKVNRSRVKKFFNRLHLGKLTYVYYLIKELFTFKPFDVTILVDGKEKKFSKVWLVTVANHPYIGGGMKLLPEANPLDGRFDCIIVHDISRLKILTLFISVFWGGHVGLKGVTIIKGKNLHIEPDLPVYQHADGEYIGNGSVEVTVSPSDLSVLAQSGTSTVDLDLSEWEHKEFPC